MKCAKKKGESAVTLPWSLPVLLRTKAANSDTSQAGLRNHPCERPDWTGTRPTGGGIHTAALQLPGSVCLALPHPFRRCPMLPACYPLPVFQRKWKTVSGRDYAALLLRFSQNSLRSYRRRFKKKRTKTFCFAEKGERKRIKCFSPSLWSSYSAQHSFPTL